MNKNQCIGMFFLKHADFCSTHKFMAGTESRVKNKVFFRNQLSYIAPKIFIRNEENVFVIKIFDDFEKMEPVSNAQGTTAEIKNAAKEFSFASPAEDAPLNIDLGSDENAAPGKDQLNIF